MDQAWKNTVKEAVSKMGPTMMLYSLDLGGEDAISCDDEVFESALDIIAAASHSEIDGYLERYLAAKGDQLESLIEMDMRDNYVAAAVALKKLPMIPRSIPAVAWAAFNKHTYPGINRYSRDEQFGAPGHEFALVRALKWAGFDLDAQIEDSGYTAMHYFASTKVSPFSNPRAVAWLIANGANPDIKNAGGDTPLIYLSASVKWTDELTMSYNLLFANPNVDCMAVANDGKGHMDVMMETDPMAPHPWRQAQIAKWEQYLMEQSTPDALSDKRSPL